jgi:hypothetical protein
MRPFPGWVAGALGVGALVGAFYLGGRVGATSATSAPLAATDLSSVAPAENTAATPELAVACEPGQRAVVRTAPGAAPSVACVSDATPVRVRPQMAEVRYAAAAPAPAEIVRVADRDDRPYARPAVITEPVEVYRPRSRPVSDETREVAAPKRTVKKSVAIIAGSTAAGAVMGGLVKGKKGAVVGGLLGGGAATVWDQVTRRQGDVR